MSDGPHKSLKLEPHWKAVAERASKDAWTISEVVEATLRALERDLREVPIRSMRCILGVGPEASLFAQDADAVVAELDRSRIECRGSAIGNAAIDGALQAVLDGDWGEVACQRSIQYALDRNFRNHSRSIEEHWQREAGDRSARHMRDRLAAVGGRCDFGDTARRHSQADLRTARASALERQTGIDDGPAMQQ